MGLAWHHKATGVPNAQAQSVVHALRESGLDVPALEDPDRGPVGVFICSARTSANAYAELRTLALGGSRRILAVDLDERPPNSAPLWALLHNGASDAVHWAEYAADPGPLVHRLLRWLEIEDLLNLPPVRQRLIGDAPTWQNLLRHVVEVARFSSTTLLILGESGTGKELAAHLLHALDPRPARRDLIIVDCTTIVPELSGSEFFGHERGAYTGAIGARQGAISRADGGTLFLDEVAELPLPLQAQLLRVIQEGTYKAVGGDVWRRADFRLVCATNRDLAREMHKGRFRPDLYYRIAASVVHVPPLRERRQDITALARHFLAEAGVHVPLDPGVERWLSEREYPGNVRELRQIVLQAAHRHVGDGPITVGDLPQDARPTDGLPQDRSDALAQAVARAVASGWSLRQVRQAVEEAAIRSALESSPSQREACVRLGVTPRAVQLRARRQAPPARPADPHTHP